MQTNVVRIFVLDIKSKKMYPHIHCHAATIIQRGWRDYLTRSPVMPPSEIRDMIVRSQPPICSPFISADELTTMACQIIRLHYYQKTPSTKKILRGWVLINHPKIHLVLRPKEDIPLGRGGLKKIYGLHLFTIEPAGAENSLRQRKITHVMAALSIIHTDTNLTARGQRIHEILYQFQKAEQTNYLVMPPIPLTENHYIQPLYEGTFYDAFHKQRLPHGHGLNTPRTISFADISLWLLQICASIKWLETKQYAHKDLNMKNIFISSSDALIADFDWATPWGYDRARSLHDPIYCFWDPCFQRARVVTPYADRYAVCLLLLRTTLPLPTPTFSTIEPTIWQDINNHEINRPSHYWKKIPSLTSLNSVHPSIHKIWEIFCRTTQLSAWTGAKFLELNPENFTSPQQVSLAIKTIETIWQENGLPLYSMDDLTTCIQSLPALPLTQQP